MEPKLKWLVVAGGVGFLVLLSLTLFRQLNRGCGVDARVVVARAAVGGNGPIAGAVARFHTDTGRFPTTREGLAALFEAPDTDRDRWHGPYLDGTIEELIDPWGEAYNYKYTRMHNTDSFDLWSSGRNRVSEPDDPDSDDIRNWENR